MEDKKEYKATPKEALKEAFDDGKKLAKVPAPAPTPAPEPEVEEENGYGETPFQGDYMEVTIQVAQNLEQYAKAVDQIINFMIKRTYPGDWVSHDKESTPPEERSVNMIGAAAERIARDLGVSELNRTTPVKVWDEKHPGHYQFRCEGEFSFRGRKVKAQGIASTRNPFYSRKYDRDVDPKEIREEYLIRESWRDCVKQGIKGLFGLRKIPLLKLQELGYDINKVKYVNFRSDPKSQTKANPAATAAPAGVKATTPTLTLMTTKLVEHKESKSTAGAPLQKWKDVKGLEFMLWRPADHPETQQLALSIVHADPVTFEFSYDGKYRTIKRIIITEQQSEPQEDQ